MNRPPFNTPHLNLSNAVVDILGGPDAAETALSTLHGTFECIACGKVGNADTGIGTAVVVVAYPDGHTVVRLAHRECRDSGIVLIGTDTAVTISASAVAWLRPDDADPSAIVVIAPRIAAVRVTEDGHLVNDAVTRLLSDGFTRLADDMSALTPAAVDLTVTFGPDPHEVTIGDGRGGYLYQGDLIVPNGWHDAIHASGVLGVVVAAGLDLDDTGRDPLADLFLSVYEGTAVGAAVRVRCL